MSPLNSSARILLSFLALSALAVQFVSLAGPVVSSTTARPGQLESPAGSSEQAASKPTAEAAAEFVEPTADELEEEEEASEEDDSNDANDAADEDEDKFADDYELRFFRDFRDFGGPDEEMMEIDPSEFALNDDTYDSDFGYGDEQGMRVGQKSQPKEH